MADPFATRGKFKRRPGKKLIIFSGHGSWDPKIKEPYVQVPKKSQFCFFTENMKTISDSFGGRVEKWGALLGILPEPDQIIGEFKNMPNMMLHPPFNPTLNIQKMTAEECKTHNAMQIILRKNAASVSLKDLFKIMNELKIPTEDVDMYWAACRAIDLKPVGGEKFGVNDMQR